MHTIGMLVLAGCLGSEPGDGKFEAKPAGSWSADAYYNLERRYGFFFTPKGALYVDGGEGRPVLAEPSSGKKQASVGPVHWFTTGTGWRYPPRRTWAAAPMHFREFRDYGWDWAILKGKHGPEFARTWPGDPARVLARVTLKVPPGIEMSVPGLGAVDLDSTGRQLVIFRHGDEQDLLFFDANTGTFEGAWKLPRIAMPFGRDNSRQGVRWVPGGRHLILVETTRLFEFDARIGRIQRVFPAADMLDHHAALPGRLVFSGNGRVMACTNVDQTRIHLWDRWTGKCLPGGIDLGDHGAANLALNEEGTLLAVLVNRRKVSTWKLTLPRPAATPAPEPLGEPAAETSLRTSRFCETGPVLHVSFSADGKEVRTTSVDWVSGQPDLSVRNFPSGRLLRRFSPRSPRTFQPAGIAALGERYFVDSIDGANSRLREIATGKVLQETKNGGFWLPEGGRHVVRSDYRTVEWWDLRSKERRSIDLPLGHLVLGVTPKVLVTGWSWYGRDVSSRKMEPQPEKDLRVFDLATGRLLHRFPGSAEGYEEAVALGDRFLMVRCATPQARKGRRAPPLLERYDLVAGRKEKGGQAAEPFTFAMKATKDGCLLALLGPTMVVLWDPAQGRETRRWVLPRGSVGGSLAFSPDGRFLLVGGAASTPLLFDAAHGQAIHQGHLSEILALAFSRDGRSLASIDAHGRLVVHDLVNKGSRLLREETEPVKEPWNYLRPLVDPFRSEVAWHAEGGIQAIWPDGRLIHHEVRTGKTREERLSPRYESSVTVANRFASTRPLRAEWDPEEGLIVRNAATGKPVRTIPVGGGGGRRRAATGFLVSLSEDGKTLRVLNGLEGVEFAGYKLLVWDVPTGKTMVNRDLPIATQAEEVSGNPRHPGRLSLGQRLYPIGNEDSLPGWAPFGGQGGILRTDYFGLLPWERTVNQGFGLGSEPIAVFEEAVSINNGPKGHLLLGIRNTVFQVLPEKNQVVRAFHVEKLLAETARMTPNESHLVALDAHRNVHVWDMATARYLGRIGKTGEGITCFALAPQGSRIALGRTDATIVLRDLKALDRLRPRADAAGLPHVP